MKTLAEFRDEMKALRMEMFQNAEMADTKLVASWVDRLVLSLEGLADTVEMMGTELDVANECCCMAAPAPKAKKAPKTAGKKKAKAAKKGKRR